MHKQNVYRNHVQIKSKQKACAILHSFYLLLVCTNCTCFWFTFGLYACFLFTFGLYMVSVYILFVHAVCLLSDCTCFLFTFTIQHLNKPKVNRKLVQTESKQTACTIRKQTETMYKPKVNRKHVQSERML
jgi:hypothetical protein